MQSLIVLVAALAAVAAALLLAAPLDGAWGEAPLQEKCAYGLPADPPGALHGDENVSGEPIEVMVIELAR